MRWQISRLLLLQFILFFSLLASEKQPVEEKIALSFRDVPMGELVRYVSRQSQSSFLFDEKELSFPVTLVSSDPYTPDELLKVLLILLKERGLRVKKSGGLYLIGCKNSSSDGVVAPYVKEERLFALYKLQYHKGDEILSVVQKMGPELADTPELASVIQSLQWLPTTNSLLSSGSQAATESLHKLLASLDTARKQVLIEVLVIETDVREGLEFGLEWSGGAEISGQGAKANPLTPPKNPSSFQLGVIGDLLFYKGRGFGSLSALISALEKGHEGSIVLSQKILSQDHKHSKIFVGNNIPFAGAYVQTVGASQQTTANIEYRDVGVLLEITPLLGDERVITLEIRQEMSEAMQENAGELLSGVQTTKTHMDTSVHVPDGHFLVLSGMTRSTQSKGHRGLPCLGSLPFIGSLFGTHYERGDKKQLIIFLCPKILDDATKEAIPLSEMSQPIT